MQKRADQCSSDYTRKMKGGERSDWGGGKPTTRLTGSGGAFAVSAAAANEFHHKIEYLMAAANRVGEVIA
jgi:hypothetical protein